MARCTRWSAVAAALFAGLVTGARPMAQTSPAVEPILAEAKLLETKGELAAAERKLRDALPAADAKARPALVAALAELLRRLGRAREADELAAPAAGAAAPAVPRTGSDDPVALLVQQLDLGTAIASPVVAQAQGQLSELGPLANPYLLAALPRLGPFGVTNALALLHPRDPTVMATLVARLDAGDARLASALAQRLGTYAEDAPAAAVVLAQKLAQCAPEARLAALTTLIQRAPGDAATLRLAAELASEKSERTALAVALALGEAGGAWGRPLLERLREHASPAVRLAATRAWLSTLGPDDEQTALDALSRMPRDEVAQFGSLRSEWVRVAAMLLPVVEPNVATHLLRHVEWWRVPEVGGGAILALANSSGLTGHKRDALTNLWQRGFVPSPDSDADLLAFAATFDDRRQQRAQLLLALPEHAETRALALMAKMPESQRRAFAFDAMQDRGSWLRVAATLLDAPSPQTVEFALARDWTGAPPEVVAKLVALAQGADASLTDGLASAWSHSSTLPSSIGLRLLTTNHAPSAMSRLVEREPRAVLDFLRTATPLREDLAWPILSLLRRNGTVADVPLALRLARELDFLISLGDGVEELTAFLRQQGQGNLEIVSLARVPTTVTILQVWDARLAAATTIAGSVQAADFAAALALAPALNPQVGATLLTRLEALAAKEHLPLLARFVEALASQPLTGSPGGDAQRVGGLGSVSQLRYAVGMLRATGDPGALPALRRVLALVPAGDEELVGAARETIAAAADAALHVAGATRRALLEELLASPRAELVRAALVAPDLAADEKLRQLARQAILAVGHDLRDVYELFARLPPEFAVTLATDVLTDARLPVFTTELVTAALLAVGARKDPALVPVLARGAAHLAFPVRMTTATQLGRTFAREAAPCLIELLKDDDHRVRDTAKAQLAVIADYLKARAEWEARFK